MALADADEDSSDGEGYVLGVPAVDADGLVETPPICRSAAGTRTTQADEPQQSHEYLSLESHEHKKFATASELQFDFRPTDWDLERDGAGPAGCRARFTMDADVTGHGSAAKRLNGHERVRPLAEGAHGKLLVYRCLATGAYRCVKVYHKRRMRRMRTGALATGLSDIQRECLAWGRIDWHPNVVRVHQAVCDPESPKVYLLMDLLPGGNVLSPGPYDPPPTLDAATGRLVLSDAPAVDTESFRAVAALPAPVVRTRIRDVLRGIQHLHRAGIVHGDVKPSNLLLAPDGLVQVSDLGAVQVVDPADPRIDRSIGTPAFTAPECCRGGTFDGFKYDAWCVGVTLHLLLFGCMPVWSPSADALFRALEGWDGTLACVPISLQDPQQGREDERHAWHSRQGCGDESGAAEEGIAAAGHLSSSPRLVSDGGDAPGPGVSENEGQSPRRSDGCAADDEVGTLSWPRDLIQVLCGLLCRRPEDRLSIDKAAAMLEAATGKA